MFNGEYSRPMKGIYRTRGKIKPFNANVCANLSPIYADMCVMINGIWGKLKNGLRGLFRRNLTCVTWDFFSFSCRSYHNTLYLPDFLEVSLTEG